MDTTILLENMFIGWEVGHELTKEPTLDLR